MLNAFRIRWNQFLEESRQKSTREAINKMFATYLHLNRIVVPVYADLTKLKQSSKGKTEDISALEFLIVDKNNVAAVAGMNKTASRRLKMPHHTRAGYYAYAVVSNGEIIGDIWCATPRGVEAGTVHSDLVWLGIECGENDAYMFDMYVTPDSRGKAVASYLLWNALNHLKESGFDRVYGFYEKNNLPALWTHRLFGYTELTNRKVTHILLYERSEPVPTVVPSGT
jgi:GNAT superfamily N-acetyltransferase